MLENYSPEYSSPESKKERESSELGRKLEEEKELLIQEVLKGKRSALEAIYIIPIEEAFDKLEEKKPEQFKNKTPEEVNFIKNLIRGDLYKNENVLRTRWDDEQDQKLQRQIDAELRKLSNEIREQANKIDKNRLKELLLGYYEGVSYQAQLEGGAINIMGTMSEKEAREHTEYLIEKYLLKK